MMLTIGARAEVFYNSACPEGEPAFGWNSTCDAPYIELPLELRTTGRKI